MTNTTIETYTFAQFRACLEAALVCTSKDLARPSLTRIEVNEAHMHATDGHRLLRVGRLEVAPGTTTAESHMRRRVHIPRADAEWFLKAYSAKTAGDFPGLVTITNGAVAYNGEVLRKWKPVDVDFPLVDQVIPATQKNAPPCPTIGFTLAYIGDMQKIGKAIGATETVFLGSHIESNFSPTLWHMKGDDLSALYVLMPVRI
jgi:hypothetical protein